MDLKSIKNKLIALNLIDRKNFNGIKKAEKEIKIAFEDLFNDKSDFLNKYPEGKFIDMVYELDGYVPNNLKDLLHWHIKKLKESENLRVEKKEAEDRARAVDELAERINQEEKKALENAFEEQRIHSSKNKKKKKGNKFISGSKLKAGLATMKIYEKK